MRGSPWRLSIMYRRSSLPSRYCFPPYLAGPLVLHCRPVVHALQFLLRPTTVESPALLASLHSLACQMSVTLHLVDLHACLPACGFVGLKPK